MKEIWVLSVKTSLPEVCYNADSLVTTFFAFEHFSDAKNALRNKVKELAFSTSIMFDGNGNVNNLLRYIEDEYMWGDPGEDDETYGILTHRLLDKVNELLRSAFEGNDTPLEIPDKEYDDGRIAVKVSANEINIYGCESGPMNGYDPVIHTNIFVMEKETDYFLYINDLFGQEEGSAELYIDLKRTTLE